MRAVPDSLSPGVVAGIDLQLDELERAGEVRILWAVESGSRAWGFPSPDSDYDCRFVYAHPADRYLSPWPARDVIELPPDPVFDLNGWDLVKAVRLLTKGNATVGEWLRSPIVYRGDEAFRDAFLELVDKVFDLDRVRAHYLHIGLRNWPGNPDDERLKPRMYSLRAAATLRWLRARAGGVPPMQLTSLLAQADVPARLRAQVDELIERKSRTREAGPGGLPVDLVRFVDEEFALAAGALDATSVRPDSDAGRRAATAFFQRWVGGVPPRSAG